MLYEARGIKDTTFEAKTKGYNGHLNKINLIVREDTLPGKGIMDMYIEWLAQMDREDTMPSP
jgi:hypothetical protein